MSTDPTTPALPFHVPDQLAVLLDALDGLAISDRQRRTLAFMSGWEPDIVEDLADLITRYGELKT